MAGTKERDTVAVCNPETPSLLFSFSFLGPRFPVSLTFQIMDEVQKVHFYHGAISLGSVLVLIGSLKNPEYCIKNFSWKHL